MADEAYMWRLAEVFLCTVNSCCCLCLCRRHPEDRAATVTWVYQDRTVYFSVSSSSVVMLKPIVLFYIGFAGILIR